MFVGTTLEHLRKKRSAFLPSKRRKNNDLVFSNLFFEGRCFIQLSHGRAVCFCNLITESAAWDFDSPETRFPRCAQFCAHRVLARAICHMN
jgi:hypothetical protein